MKKKTNMRRLVVWDSKQRDYLGESKGRAGQETQEVGYATDFSEAKTFKTLRQIRCFIERVFGPCESGRFQVLELSARKPYKTLNQKPMK